MVDKQLNVGRLSSLLDGSTIGADLHYFVEIDSTNRALRDLPEGSWCHGTVVITDYQTAGRGRQGRSWAAPPGSSLLLSTALAWPEQCPLAQSVMLGALAILDTVERVSELTATLKWPNDVLLNGRKVCGILAETATAESQRFVILGTGLNVNFDVGRVAGISGAATSLQLECGRLVDREALAAALFTALDYWYERLTRDRSAIFSAWERRLDVRGQHLTVTDAGGTWTGVATGVDPAGGLHLTREDAGRETVYAADVSIRSH
ncbi:MAG: biotin--[acetyl-CoA-carboxylase] ligase [Chloroflexota bacterium]